MELIDHDVRMTPQRVLGQQLRRLRERAEMSQRRFGDEIRYPHSYLGRVERGDQVPSEALARALDNYFGTCGLFIDLLEAVHDSLIADDSQAFVRQEAHAVRMQVVTSSFVPGLLQTADYVRAFFRLTQIDASAELVEARVTARIRRQRVLDDAAPPFLWAVMDEAALKRRMGDEVTMRGQLQHLVAMAEKPHVRIHVLPFDQGAHPALGGALTLLTKKDGRVIAHEEGFYSGRTVESPRGVATLAQLFDAVSVRALPEDASLDLVRSYLDRDRDDT